MRPEDVAGLEAILLLLEEVLKHSETNRTLIYENTQWHIVESLFGLLTCPVQTSLKARLMLAITALAKSPDLVGKVRLDSILTW